MSPLILAHVASGLIGIGSGGVIVVGIFRNKRHAWVEALFFVMSAAACGTGFVFLPSGGVTSAQLVSFFLVSLLGLAAYARYRQQCQGHWNPIYALAVVGALFLNVLITTAQSFLHVPMLKGLAPTQQSPIYIAVKIALLLSFIIVAVAAARQADRS